MQFAHISDRDAWKIAFIYFGLLLEWINGSTSKNQTNISEHDFSSD